MKITVFFNVHYSVERIDFENQSLYTIKSAKPKPNQTKTIHIQNKEFRRSEYLSNKEVSYLALVFVIFFF